MNEDGGDKNRGFRKICLFCRIKAAGTGFEFWMKSILSKCRFGGLANAICPVAPWDWNLPSLEVKPPR